MDEISHEISLKSSKKELLEAFKKVTDKYHKLKNCDPKELTSITSEDRKIFKKVARISKESVLNEIKKLRVATDSALDQLSSQMIKEIEKFVEIEKAVASKQSMLEELLDIKVVSGVAKTLVEEHTETMKKLEADYEKRKSEIDKMIEKKRLEGKTVSDEILQKKKDHEKDLKEKLKDFDSEMQKKGSRLRILEEEVKSLSKQVSAFPKTLEKESTEKVKQALQTKEKDFDSERRELETRIRTLEAAIVKQDAQIDKLLEKIVVVKPEPLVESDDEVKETKTFIKSALDSFRSGVTSK